VRKSYVQPAIYVQNSVLNPVKVF